MNEVKSGRREMLLVNGREIPVAVVRSRRARRYVLRLRADGLARLTIPRRGSAREAWEFAQRQGAWLERQLQYFASRPVRPREWRAGTEILFRGELLKISVTSALTPALSPRRGGIIGRWFGTTIDGVDSTIPRQSSPGIAAGNTIRLGDQLIPVLDIAADLRPAIECYLQAMAREELPARTLEFAGLHHLSVRRVIVRAQRTRWGSCSFKGIISLNWRLIQTPPFVRDYIILHELMHLRQMNHSARFWREVERVCPNYRKAKLWLKENPGLLE